MFYGIISTYSRKNTQNIKLSQYYLYVYLIFVRKTLFGQPLFSFADRWLATPNTVLQVISIVMYRFLSHLQIQFSQQHFIDVRSNLLRKA